VRKATKDELSVTSMILCWAGVRASTQILLGSGTVEETFVAHFELAV
jgi:hypothetical protein